MKQFIYLDSMDEANKLIGKLERNPNVSMINLSKHNLLLSYNIEINNLENLDIRLDRYAEDFVMYDYYSDGEFICQIEVQFDDYEFSGKIYGLTEDENEKMEYEEITDGGLYEYLEARAIKDFRKIYG